MQSRECNVGRTVLLVENDEAIRDLIESALKGWGCTVVTARDSHTAFTIIRNYIGQIDLLLSDVSLPNSSGWKIAKTAEDQRPAIKCLLMSGYDRVSSSEQRANWRFIQKPFRLNELRSSISELLSPDKNGDNPQDRRDVVDQKSIFYFEMRLRELTADLRAFKLAYEKGELDRDAYIGISRSIRQVIREVRVALEKINRS